MWPKSLKNKLQNCKRYQAYVEISLPSKVFVKLRINKVLQSHKSNILLIALQLWLKKSKIWKQTIITTIQNFIIFALDDLIFYCTAYCLVLTLLQCGLESCLPCSHPRGRPHNWKWLFLQTFKDGKFIKDCSVY